MTTEVNELPSRSGSFATDEGSVYSEVETAGVDNIQISFETVNAPDVDTSVSPLAASVSNSSTRANTSNLGISTPDSSRPVSGARDHSDSVGSRGFVRKVKGKLVSINDYEIGNTIGKGAFAEVKLGTLKDKKYAIKIIETDIILKKFAFGSRPGSSKAHDQMQLITSEIEVMKILNHPNLVSLCDVMHDDENIYLVMDFIEGGPIMKYNAATRRFRCTLSSSILGNSRGELSEDCACRVFRGLMSGLGYLHQNHIAHRDLKPENLLVDLDGNIKITDFGVSSHFTEERQKAQITLKQLAKSLSRGKVTKTEGTMVFYSPEMCLEVPQTYSAYMADIWAAGVCLWVFIFNVLPFFHADIRVLFREIREKDPMEQLTHSISSDLLDLFKKILAKEVSDRPSIADIEEHPWMMTDVHETVRSINGITEGDEDEEEEESNPTGPKSKIMETNFSDYFATMISEMHVSDSDEESEKVVQDEASTPQSSTSKPELKTLESTMSNASYLCSNSSLNSGDGSDISGDKPSVAPNSSLHQSHKKVVSPQSSESFSGINQALSLLNEESIGLRHDDTVRINKIEANFSNSTKDNEIRSSVDVSKKQKNAYEARDKHDGTSPEALPPNGCCTLS